MRFEGFLLANPCIRNSKAVKRRSSVLASSRFINFAGVGYSVSLEGTPEIGTEAEGLTLGAGDEVAGAVVLTPAGVVAGATGDAAARSEDARSSPSRCFGVTRASASFL